VLRTEDSTHKKAVDYIANRLELGAALRPSEIGRTQCQSREGRRGIHARAGSPPAHFFGSAVKPFLCRRLRTMLANGSKTESIAVAKSESESDEKAA